MHRSTTLTFSEVLEVLYYSKQPQFLAIFSKKTFPPSTCLHIHTHEYESCQKKREKQRKGKERGDKNSSNWFFLIYSGWLSFFKHGWSLVVEKQSRWSSACPKFFPHLQTPHTSTAEKNCQDQTEGQVGKIDGGSCAKTPGKVGLAHTWNLPKQPLLPLMCHDNGSVL